MYPHSLDTSSYGICTIQYTVLPTRCQVMSYHKLLHSDKYKKDTSNLFMGHNNHPWLCYTWKEKSSNLDQLYLLHSANNYMLRKLFKVMGNILLLQLAEAISKQNLYNCVAMGYLLMGPYSLHHVTCINMMSLHFYLVTPFLYEWVP